MPARVWVLATALLVMSHHTAMPQSLLVPEIAFEGSLPLYFGDNPAHEFQRHSDYALAPYFKLSASGPLVDDIHYSLYLSAGNDTYYSLNSENDTFAGLTAQLSKRWGIFEVGVSYARVMYYGGLFDDLFTKGNDFGLFGRVKYKDASGSLKIEPYVSSSVRSDDAGALQRTYVQFKLDVEQKLNDRWAFVLTPILQYYDYFGTVPPYRDTAFSVTSGFKYKLTDYVDLTPIVGYETRVSTLSLRNYTNRFVGASLDFSFLLLGTGSERERTGRR